MTFEDGPAQLASTLAAARVAGELDALSPQDKEGLNSAVAEVSRPLMADRALRSQSASYLAIARRSLRVSAVIAFHLLPIRPEFCFSAHGWSQRGCTTPTGHGA